jgi:hypothetical protein
LDYLLCLELIFSSNRDAVDLQIASGIRTPTYSTNLALTLTTDGEEDVVHNASVSQLESLDTLDCQSSVAMSQFVSLDESGVVIFWITSERQSALHNDLRQSPWGRVSLLPTRTISIGVTSQRLRSGTISNSLTAFSSVESVLAVDFSDSSFMFVGNSQGQVSKIGRSGESQSSVFHKMVSNTQVSSIKTNQSPLQLHLRSFQQVTCMAVNYVPSSTLTRPFNNILSLLLVGHDDGSLDLFHVDGEYPLSSWSLSSFDNGKMSKSPGVRSVFWMTEYVFLAIDTLGSCFVFDLYQSVDEPVHITKIDIGENFRDAWVDVSTVLNAVTDMRIVIGFEGELALYTRPLCPSLKVTAIEPPELQTLNEKLLSLTIKSRNIAEIIMV